MEQDEEEVQYGLCHKTAGQVEELVILCQKRVNPLFKQFKGLNFYNLSLPEMLAQYLVHCVYVVEGLGRTRPLLLICATCLLSIGVLPFATARHTVCSLQFDYSNENT